MLVSCVSVTTTGPTDSGASPDSDPPRGDDVVHGREVPDGYYAGTEGLTGGSLKTALHDIVSDHTVLTYDEVWEALRVTDEAPGDPADVVLLYSGTTRDADDNGGGSGDWNREHVWPKSRGDLGTHGPGSDLHHLRPTDVRVNSIRDSKDFDLGGEPVDGAPGTTTDDDSFAPRDEVRGDVARMVLYMAVRYEGDGAEPDLELDDRTGTGSVPRLGRLPVLLDWHAADPPDAFERRRNALIHEQFQHNRNPFIDHPEWAAAIWR
ncbi:endonuclease I family protein [Saccharomonospora iraqiensis]|uniref:endonuclease I family protein n=1 Tax=Saccharomonospora iraqiensis TaxID=52698 RepID=UPI00047ED4AB|nr:endonuclease [Saccharomonospora iraqiensis]